MGDLLVKQSPRHIRVAPEYFALRQKINLELEPSLGRRLSDREITAGIASFMEKEHLVPIMVRRARRKAKRRQNLGGLFD